MSHYESLWPGRFLKKESLPAPKVIRILALNRTELEGEKGVENKVVMKYKASDGEGELVVCKTNGALIAAALNETEFEKWIGRLITLYNNPNVDLAGKRVGGIRVYGSPELTAKKRVEIKRPRRKKPEVYDLFPTDNKGNVKQAAASAPVPEPEPPSDVDSPPPGDDFGDEAAP